NARRADLVAAYRAALEKMPGWTATFSGYDGDSAYHLMVAVAPDADSRVRAADALREARIQSSMHYPCVADFSGFKAFETSRLERCREFARRAITLPLFPTMTLEQVGQVCAVL